MHDICTDSYENQNSEEVDNSDPLKGASGPAFDSLKIFLDNLDPETNHWTIPEQEISQRLDLRKKRIFTIDPITAKDLDDALSIDKVSEFVYEIGVHIADVSYFVQ